MVALVLTLRLVVEILAGLKVDAPKVEKLAVVAVTVVILKLPTEMLDAFTLLVNIETDEVVWADIFVALRVATVTPPENTPVVPDTVAAETVPDAMIVCPLNVVKEQVVPVIVVRD